MHSVKKYEQNGNEIQSVYMLTFTVKCYCKDEKNYLALYLLCNF